MFESHDLNHPVYHNVTDSPGTYDFIEISQNNHQSGQTHYDKIQSVRQRIATAPRPLSNVKIYGSDGSGLFGTSRDAMERFWRIIFAGCASARFHEKHLGDSELAQRMIRSAREVTRSFDLFHCAPHNELLLDRAPNQAYCLANPGKEYVIYFPKAGGVQLDTRALRGRIELRWYDIDSGKLGGRNSSPSAAHHCAVHTGRGSVGSNYSFQPGSSVITGSICRDGR
jgi:hypothetical protein